MTVVIAIHIDEFQMYSSGLVDVLGLSAPVARKAFKDMISAMNNVVREQRIRCAKLALVPIVTGTPVLGLQFVTTKKLSELPIQPALLDRNAAVEVAAEVFGAELRDASRSVFQEDVPAFVLADTGYLPRLVVSLAEDARGLVEVAKVVDAARPLDNVD